MVQQSQAKEESFRSGLKGWFFGKFSEMVILEMAFQIEKGLRPLHGSRKARVQTRSRENLKKAECLPGT